MRALVAATVAASVLIGATTTVSAQPYPSRPVKIIIDVGIGGTYDIFARALAEELHKKMGQPFIVEPRGGAGGMIGTRACAEAAPDGYTICVLSNSFVVNEFLYKSAPYSRTAITPIMNLFYNTQVIVVNAGLGVRTLDELVALAKAKPGTLNFVVPGVFQRAFFDKLNKKHGIDLVGIPFKGGGDALTGVLSGNIPIAYIGGANFAPYVREGKMVALAVDSTKRSPLFPDAPTLSEAGYNEPMVRNYLAVVVPTGTPEPIITRLHADITAIMKDPAFLQRHVIERGLEPVVDTREAFARFLEADLATTGAVVKELGLQPQ